MAAGARVRTQVDEEPFSSEDKHDETAMQVSFGDFVLDSDSRELRRGPEPVRLSPKALQLLQILVTGRPKALSKADLQNRLWPDTFVVEKNLANLISEIREALGEDPLDPRFIRTVPRYGYAFRDLAAEINGVEDWGPAGHLESWRRAALALGAGGTRHRRRLCSVVSARSRRRPRTTERIMLAVLPFQNLTGDPEQQYLCDGLTEEMIAHLGGVDPSRLGVIARTSAMHYKNTTKRADEIARELGVAYLLETSLRRIGNRVRITAQLIEAQTQGHVWAEQYERDALDVLALQREVAAAVARRTLSSLGVSVGNRDSRAERHSNNARAYEHYLRGPLSLGQRHDRRTSESAGQLSEGHRARPVVRAGLQWVGRHLRTAGQLRHHADQRVSPAGPGAALKALELDESLAEAHRSLAAIIADHYWDWGEVERHYRRAIALDPNDVTTLRFYSFYLAYTGRPLEALPIAEQACRLDPVSPNARMNLGVVLHLARRPDEAVRQFEETLELDPNFSLAQALLGLAYLSKGMPDRAVAAVQKAARSQRFASRHRRVPGIYPGARRTAETRR